MIENEKWIILTEQKPTSSVASYCPQTPHILKFNVSIHLPLLVVKFEILCNIKVGSIVQGKGSLTIGRIFLIARMGWKFSRLLVYFELFRFVGAAGTPQPRC